jgi:hypothetical protein
MRHLEDSFVTLGKRVDMPVLAGDINQTLGVDDRRIDTPLIPVGMFVIDSRALEGPLDLEVRIKLCDKIWARRRRSGNSNTPATGSDYL